eukprot:CAMPEP_0170108344 /NCGR_PEP_ID=MMETSP0020_2-20130122/6519_1 /TAXON_ID=98059 /ORGANISM="Dinobryon sp., Strain UTEXLB2267" /LENGTH=67 /DNA_ID=CAMNT_0010333055 /DNA_START=187 /DNA_END=391 /DNA_ORIENTATION=-
MTSSSSSSSSSCSSATGIISSAFSICFSSKDPWSPVARFNQLEVQAFAPLLLDDKELHPAVDFGGAQ